MTDVPDLDRFHREAVEEGRQQIIANRWEAFTDDELGYICDAFKLERNAEQPRLQFRDGLLRWQQIQRLAEDVEAEIERRKA